MTEFKAYKVHDDEWETIYGFGQLKEFAISQVYNSPDDFLKENVAYFTDNEEIQDKIVKLANKITEEDYTDLTMEEITLILNNRSFDIDEITLY